MTSSSSAASAHPAGIAGRFAAMVGADPGAIAVIDGSRKLTYAELDSAADAVAWALHAEGVGHGHRVGILMGRSIEMISSLLGILKVGAAYVAADPTDPAARVGLVFDDATVSAVLLDADSQLLPTSAAPTLQVAKLSPSPQGFTAAPAGSDDLAYIAYTSGSTGRPKGVCVPHRGVLRLVVDPDFVSIGRDDVFVQHSPVTFDAATLEVFAPLLNGATLALAPVGQLGPREVIAFAKDVDATVMWMTAGMFHQVADTGMDLPRMRHFFAGGEVLSPEQVDRAFGQLPPGSLAAGYGPTENTTFTTTHPITEPLAGRRVPIGRAIRGTRVYVLDDDLAPVQDGQVGTLYAAGDGLAWGYLNLPALTAERFRPNPFADEPGARMYNTGDLVCRSTSGVLEFVGRADGQLKVNGVRIEPEEIEDRLRREPEVRDAAVVLQDHGPGDRRLAAFYESPSALSFTQLRHAVAQSLPRAMVPSSFTWMEALPLKANGKVDKDALARNRNRARPDLGVPYRASEGPVEAWMVQLWQEVIGIEPIGVDDDFFEIGGHSLTATRITAEILQQFGVVVRARKFYLNPTIAAVAAQVVALAETDGENNGAAA